MNKHKHHSNYQKGIKIKNRMERKINRVGTNTLTVSLPQSWVKRYQLRAGDSIAVEEQGSVLKIIAGDAKEESSKTKH